MLPGVPFRGVRPGQLLPVLLVTFLYAACGGEDSPPPRDDGPTPQPSLSPEPSGVRESGPAILFLGTSLTAGFGVDPGQAFPELLRPRLSEAGFPYRVINAGVSGETSAGALRRIDWVLDQPGIEYVVLETGANDGLRGQEVDSLRSNLLTIIARIRQDLPADRILLVGMEALPNLGPQYTTRFRQVYPDVVRQTGVRFLPFLLEGVAGVDSLNQTDGIHPSPRGHAQVADHLWPALEAMLREEGS